MAKMLVTRIIDSSSAARFGAYRVRNLTQCAHAAVTTLAEIAGFLVHSLLLL
jgi:hypothetical protein